MDLDDVLRFLSRSASWTCGPCGKYGTGFASWSAHREASPDCAAEQDREDHAGHVHAFVEGGERVVPSIHVHAPFRACPVAACWWGRRDTPASVTDPDPTRDVSATTARIRADHEVRGRWLSDVPLPEVHWWVALDVNGQELCERRPYQPGMSWVAGTEAYGLHQIGWSEAEVGPLLITAPVGKAVRVGDSITVGPASSGQVQLEVERAAKQ